MKSLKNQEIFHGRHSLIPSTDAAGDVFSLISVCRSSIWSDLSPLTFVVFQSSLDILGMVIYATEFVLWCGVFACGGYFNLLPSAQQKLKARKRKREVELSVAGHVTDSSQTNDMELERVPSSTSVFRTPSSMSRTRYSTWIREVESNLSRIDSCNRTL